MTAANIACPFCGQNLGLVASMLMTNESVLDSQTTCTSCGKTIRRQDIGVAQEPSANTEEEEAPGAEED